LAKLLGGESETHVISSLETYDYWGQGCWVRVMYTYMIVYSAFHR